MSDYEKDMVERIYQELAYNIDILDVTLSTSEITFLARSLYEDLEDEFHGSA